MSHGLGDGFIDQRLREMDRRNVTAIVKLPRPAISAQGDGAEVVEQLKEHASRTQQSLETFVGGREGLHWQNEFWISNCAVIEVDTRRASFEELARVPEVRAIHENHRVVPLHARQTSSDHPNHVGDEDVSGDSHGEHTYGLEQINAPQVWDEFDMQGEGARAVVLDTGIDPDHETLELATDEEHATDGWAEFDSVGDRVGSDPYESDENSHGTHVSATVAGGDESDRGHIGVAPGAELFHGGVLTDAGGTVAAVIAGIQWAVDLDADVVNMSLGPQGGGYFPSMIEPLANAQAVGVVPVSSCGNDGEGVSGSPANVYGDGFAVGASTESEDIATFSGGEKVITEEDWEDADEDDIDDWPDEYIVPDIAAPGQQVYSALQGDDYGSLSGTSMAAPHVAGVIALIASVSGGSVEPPEIWDRLEDTAWKPDDWDESDAEWAIDGKDSRYGEGIVDAFAAVEDFSVGTLEGTVTDAAEDGLAGVEVLTDDKRSTTTESDGSYELSLPEGDATVSVDPFGYTADSATVSITGEETTQADFSVESELDGRVLTEQPAHLESGDAIEVRIEIAHAEAIRVEQTGEYSESDLDLAVDGDTAVDFDESISVSTDVQVIEVTVATTTDVTGEIELLLRVEDTQEEILLESGATTVVESLYHIGVVDAGSEGSAIASTLADILEEEAFLVEETTTNAVMDSPEDFDGIVAQQLGSDVEGFVDSTDGDTDDIGVVYLDQWGLDSDAIPDYAALASTDVSDTGEGDRDGGPYYILEADHPILDGFATGSDVELHEGPWSDYTWFDAGDGFDVLASTATGSGVQGDGLAIDEEIRTVLAASLGRSIDVQESEFFPEANEILAAAVEYVATSSSVTLLEFEVAGEPETLTIVEGETVAYEAIAHYSEETAEEVTDELTVSSSDEAVVSFNEDGASVTAEAVGEDISITAEFEGVTDTVVLTVESAAEGELTLDNQVPEKGVVTVENVSTGQDSTVVVGYEIDGNGGADVIAAGVEAADEVDDATVDVLIEENGGFPGEHTAWVFDDADVGDLSPGDDISAVVDDALDESAAVLEAGPVSLAVDGDTVQPETTAAIAVEAEFVEAVEIRKLWIDWSIDVDTDSGAQTDIQADMIEFDWNGDMQSLATPAISITPPAQYVGGVFTVEVVASDNGNGNGSTVTERASLEIQPE